MITENSYKTMNLTREDTKVVRLEMWTVVFLDLADF